MLVGCENYRESTYHYILADEVSIQYSGFYIQSQISGSGTL